MRGDRGSVDDGAVAGEDFGGRPGELDDLVEAGQHAVQRSAVGRSMFG